MSNQVDIKIRTEAELQAATATEQALDRVGESAQNAGAAAAQAGTEASASLDQMSGAAGQGAESLENLAGAADTAGDASARASTNVDTLADSIERKNAAVGNTRGKASAAMGAVDGLSQSSRLGSQGVMSLTRNLMSLNAALGSVAMVAGSLFAGIRAGLQIQEWLWKNLVDNIKPVEGIIRKTKEEFDALNQVRLAGLRIEITELSTELSKIMSDLDRAAGREAQLRQARFAAERAEILAAQPAGPGRDRAIADVDRRAAESDIAASEQVARRKLAETEQTIAELQQRIDAAVADDRAIQEQASIARERWQRSPNAERARIGNQTRAEATASAAALAETQAAINAQIETLRQDQADAQTQLDVAGYQRSATGSTFTAAGNRAGAAEQRARLQQEQARLRAEAEAIREQQKAAAPGLQSAAEREAAEAAAAEASVAQARSQGHVGGYSIRGFEGGKRMEELVARAERERDEATEAAAAIERVLGTLAARYSQLQRQMEAVEGQIKNMP